VRITFGALPDTLGSVQRQPVFMRNTLGKLEDKLGNHAFDMKNEGRNGLSARSDLSAGREQPKIAREDMPDARPQTPCVANNTPDEAPDMSPKQADIEPARSRFDPRTDTIERAVA
jgi:hypothetical protein